jgi:hypothetical protein
MEGKLVEIVYQTKGEGEGERLAAAYKDLENIIVECGVQIVIRCLLEQVYADCKKTLEEKKIEIIEVMQDIGSICKKIDPVVEIDTINDFLLDRHGLKVWIEGKSFDIVYPFLDQSAMENKEEPLLLQ